MTQEQLQKAKELEDQIKYIENKQEILGVALVLSAPASDKCLTPMQGVMAGFFDEDLYLARVNAYLADLKKQLAEL